LIEATKQQKDNKDLAVLDEKTQNNLLKIEETIEVERTHLKKE